MLPTYLQTDFRWHTRNFIMIIRWPIHTSHKYYAAGRRTHLTHLKQLGMILDHETVVLTFCRHAKRIASDPATDDVLHFLICNGIPRENTYDELPTEDYRYIVITLCFLCLFFLTIDITWTERRATRMRREIAMRSTRLSFDR